MNTCEYVPASQKVGFCETRPYSKSTTSRSCREERIANSNPFFFVAIDLEYWHTKALFSFYMLYNFAVCCCSLYSVASISSQNEIGGIPDQPYGTAYRFHIYVHPPIFPKTPSKEVKRMLQMDQAVQLATGFVSYAANDLRPGATEATVGLLPGLRTLDMDKYTNVSI